MIDVYVNVNIPGNQAECFPGNLGLWKISGSGFLVN